MKDPKLLKAKKAVEDELIRQSKEEELHFAPDKGNRIDGHINTEAVARAVMEVFGLNWC